MDFSILGDGELATRFAEGGADGDNAFGELVRRHAAMVFRTCRRATGHHADAEDAAQLTFAALAQNAGELTQYSSLGGWLYSTAWNASRHLSRARTARRKRETEAAAARAERETEDDVSTPGDETLRELFRALQMLPADFRDAIVLHHLEGFTVEQTAQVMACSSGTTAARLSRARAIIRERLAWRGVVLECGAIEGLLLAELLREEPAPPISSHRLPELTAPVAAPIARPGFAMMVPTTAAATTAAAAASGATLAFTIAAACVSCVIGVGAVVAVNQLPRLTGVSQVFRLTGSSSATATGTSAAKTSESRSSPRTTTPYDQSAVPEPSSVSAAALTIAALTRRRVRRQE